MAAPIVIEIRQDSLVRLAGMPGTRLTCLQGALWVTYADNGKDVVLQPGETHAVSGKGPIVQAMQASRVAIEASNAALTLGCAFHAPA